MYLNYFPSIHPMGSNADLLGKYLSVTSERTLGWTDTVFEQICVQACTRDGLFDHLHFLKVGPSLTFIFDVIFSHLFQPWECG